MFPVFGPEVCSREQPVAPSACLASPRCGEATLLVRLVVVVAAEMAMRYPFLLGDVPGVAAEVAAVFPEVAAVFPDKALSFI